MYNAFFNLQCKPFEIAPDPHFLWPGERYREALATMRYGILENKGFLLLTGDAGTGKTTLVNALTGSLDETVEWAVISDPVRERLDFYNAIAKGFGIAKEFTSKVQFLIQFGHFLQRAGDDNKKVLLLIDDCHLLSQEMLEELRLLSNIEKEDAKLINIFFVGQREFQDLLVLPANRAVRQRLGLTVELAALTTREIKDYIGHRLKVAGAENRLFSAKAIQIIHQYSQGIPRRVNILCDHTMVVGSVQGTRSLDHQVVEECVRKLRLPPQPSHKDFAGLDDEKSHLEHFRGRFTAGNAETPATISGVNFENAGRYRWLKYGLGVALPAMAVIWYWYGVHQTPPVVKVGIKKEIPAAVKEIPQVIASPAVTVLGQNPEEMNQKKAAELKHAILEKAYVSGESTRQAANQQVLDADRKVGGETEKAEVAPPVDTGEVSAAPPELPARVILPLAPNSLKLTVEADGEFTRFVETLKVHPNVRLLVKGFVSSNTASAENTRLSEERAVAVQKMLVAEGVEAARIMVKGMGNQEPIASNDTSEGRSKNRRVEIAVIDR